MAKEAPFGGTGNYQNTSDAIAWLRTIDPRSVLDVGCGFGRWGFLCREFLDIWNGRRTREEWAVRLVGVDAYAGNLKQHHHYIYDELHAEPVERYLARREETFDLIILGDVLEHLPKVQGMEVLAEAVKRAHYVLLVLPLGESWDQEDEYGNPYERHLAVWHEHEILDRKPLVARRYQDYLGRPYLAAVLSSEDPKGVREVLANLAPAGGAQPTVRAERSTAVHAPQAADDGDLLRKDETPDSLHVVLVTMEYPPLFGGGIATYAFQTARLLGEAGHRVSVLTAMRDKEPPALPNVTVRTVEPPPAQDTGSYETDYLTQCCMLGRMLASRLSEVHAEQPVDLIEVTDYYTEGLFLDLSDLRKPDGGCVPVVTQFHGPRSLVTSLNSRTYPGLLTRTESVGFCNAPYRKTYSPLMRDQVDELWSGSPCAFVPSGFALPPETPADETNEHEFDLLYFGRLECRKGVIPLARAILQVVERGRMPSVCFIGGDTDTASDGGSMAEWLERTLRPRLGSRLHLKDPIPQSELWRILPKARVIVLPSLWESLGYAMLEAFCSGRPVITSRQVGAAYILEGELAERTLVDAHDEGALAERLAASMEMPEAELRQWADGLRRAVERAFEPQHVVEQIVGYYRRCIAQATDPSSASRSTGIRWSDWLSFMDELVRQFGLIKGELDRYAASVAELKAWIADLQEGKAWLEGALADQKAWSGEQEKANARLEEQRAGWERAAAESQARCAALERAMQDAEQRLGGYEAQARQWAERERTLAGEAERLSGEVTVQQGMVDELRRWSSDLKTLNEEYAAEIERLRDVLEAERDERERLRQTCSQWKRQGLFRVLRRVRLLRDLEE